MLERLNVFLGGCWGLLLLLLLLLVVVVVVVAVEEEEEEEVALIVILFSSRLAVNCSRQCTTLDLHSSRSHVYVCFFPFLYWISRAVFISKGVNHTSEPKLNRTTIIGLAKYFG